MNDQISRSNAGTDMAIRVERLIDMAHFERHFTIRS